MTITLQCQNCDCEIEIDATPGRPAKLSGRPEDCYPEEPMDFSPKCCEYCDASIDPGTVAEALTAWNQESKDAVADRQQEDQRERWGK